MPKAIWKGAISFGLVNIPVKLYSAAEPKLISFRLLCGKCGSPLEYKRWCPKCKREVPWDEVLHGFEYKKGKYVKFSKAELAKLPLPRSKNIQIIEFVDAGELDPLFFDKNYYVVPGEGAEHAYWLLKEALGLTNKVAVGKVTMRNKDYLVVLRAYKNLLLLTTLFYQDEIRPPEFPELTAKVKIPKSELKLATELIRKLSAHFDLSEFKNQYKELMLQLIEAKIAGKVIKPVPAKKPAKDLMAALKASIKAAPKKKATKTKNR